MAAIIACASAPAAAEAGWRWPVEAGVSREYRLGRDPYVAGAHRGVDLGAAPGAVVVSACAGTVVFAGTLPGGSRAVTLACGPWRVTHLPLRRLAVRAGTDVRAGRAIGVLGREPRHRGLHLGIRRAGERHGYVDPRRFLGTAGLPGDAPPLGGRRGPRSGGRTVRPLPRAGLIPAPVPAVPVSAATRPALAPAPVWVGLALVLVAGVGAGRRSRTRARGGVASQELRTAAR